MSAPIHAATPQIPRILFVDDDAALLAGLRTCLRDRARDWQMDFADSGARAIAEFERQPFDIVISDARMPSMDGAELLRIVAERWPQAVRLVLSGHADQELGVRFAPVAHQYLRKPCQPAQLDEAIKRCLQLRELLLVPSLRTMVGRIRELPVPPQALANLQTALARARATSVEIAQIVASDAVFAARVLQLANSAFFRRTARRVTNLEQAITQLGFASIRNLANDRHTFTPWHQQPAQPALDPDRTTAVAIQAPAATDVALVALLCPIGYRILLQACPEDLQRALHMAAVENITRHEAEIRTFGASEAQIGAYLLGLWGLPITIVEAVATSRHALQKESS